MRNYENISVLEPEASIGEAKGGMVPQSGFWGGGQKVDFRGANISFTGVKIQNFFRASRESFFCASRERFGPPQAKILRTPLDVMKIYPRLWC